MPTKFQQDLIDLVPRLRRFALSLAGNTHDADDLVQSGLVKALRHKDPTGQVRAWTAGCIASSGRSGLATCAAAGRGGDRGGPSIRSRSTSATMVAARHCRKAGLMLAKTKAAMAGLAKVQRAVLSLVAIQGLSQQAAARGRRGQSAP